MEEIEYADLEWAKECDVGDAITIIIDGRKFDIESINDIDDQLLRDKSMKKDSTGAIVDFKTDEYKAQLLLRCIVNPKPTRLFIEEMRKNKLSGHYTQLVAEVMKHSGTDINVYEQDKEKNSESPTESTISST